MTRKIDLPNPDDLVQAYLDGESELAMSRRLGVSRPVVQRFLDSQGVQRRGRSESMVTRMARATPDQRRAWAAAANTARRQPLPEDRPRTGQGEKAARSGAESCSRTVGNGEAELCDLLIGRGLDVTSQTPVGGYNVDLTIGTVAVEVWWGQSYPLRLGRNRNARKTVDLGYLGWSTIWVWLSRQTPDHLTADAVVAFLDECGGDPPTVAPQYRVVRRDGEIVAGGEAQTDPGALVPPSHR